MRDIALLVVATAALLGFFILYPLPPTPVRTASQLFRAVAGPGYPFTAAALPGVGPELLNSLSEEIAHAPAEVPAAVVFRLVGQAMLADIRRTALERRDLLTPVQLLELLELRAAGHEVALGLAWVLSGRAPDLLHKAAIAGRHFGVYMQLCRELKKQPGTHSIVMRLGYERAYSEATHAARFAKLLLTELGLDLVIANCAQARG